jgi:prepilin-type N-terminal cleavage/methylation domain-containing protein
MKNKKPHHNIANSHRHKGFTLLETLIAILILSAVLSGFISVVIISLRSFETAKQKYLAAKIGQEGMELLINKKDNNVICVESGSCPISDWQENLIGSWEVDATEINSLLPAQTFNSYDPSNYICIIETGPDAGMFGYCGDPKNYIDGNFTRELNVISLGNENILVKSIVRWKNRGISKELTLEEILFGLP